MIDQLCTFVHINLHCLMMNPSIILKVIHPYKAESDVELTLAVGDYVVVRKVCFAIFDSPVIYSILRHILFRLSSCPIFNFILQLYTKNENLVRFEKNQDVHAIFLPLLAIITKFSNC